jgi:protein ImuA
MDHTDVHVPTPIEDLLRSPHVWRGRRESSNHPVVTTGFAALDSKLSGGWPWGAITEIFVERYGVGELSVLMPMLASLSRRDEGDSGWIVCIAPPWIPYAPALSRWGVKLERVLLVDPSTSPGKWAGGTRRDAGEENDHALWATEQALLSGASAAVLTWLHSASDQTLRRLQLAAEEQRCGLVLFRPVAALRQRSPAALRLKLSCTAEGETRIEILKCRGARPAEVCLDLSRYGVAAGDSRLNRDFDEGAAGAAGGSRSGEAGCR